MSYTSKYTGQEIDNRLDEVNNKANQSDLINLQNTKLNISDLLDKVYPVGSVYVSYASTSPASLFGGIWTQIKDRFLLAAGDTYNATSTGGAATVTLTSDQMPSHTHTFTGLSATTSSAGAHTHDRGSMNITGTFNPYSEGGGVPTMTSSMTGAFYGVSSTQSGWGTSTGLDQDNYLIGFDASRSWTGSTSSNGAHTHTLTANGTNASTGGGESHSNMPPYLTLYMWRRTA